MYCKKEYYLEYELLINNFTVLQKKTIRKGRTTLSYFSHPFLIQAYHNFYFVTSQVRPNQLLLQHLSRHFYYIHIFFCTIIKNKLDGTWDSRCHRNVTQAFFSYYNKKLCQESRGCSITC